MTTESGNRTYSFYPGCSLIATNKTYDASTKKVAGQLKVKLIDLEDWNCCGATAYMAIMERKALVLSARNLALAEKEGRDLVMVCSGCYVVLKKTNKYLAGNGRLRAEIQRALAAGGMSYDGTVRVRHFLEVLVEEIGAEAVGNQVRRPLTGLKVVPYYGCQITRPFGGKEEAEFPESLDRLLRWLGADPVPFPLKSKWCCGGLMITTQPSIGRMMTGKILASAVAAEADCIATLCPLCYLNLEAYQRRVGAEVGADCRIPVVYFTQLMEYAFGLGAKESTLNDCLTPAREVLTQRVGPA